LVTKKLVAMKPAGNNSKQIDLLHHPFVPRRPLEYTPLHEMATIHWLYLLPDSFLFHQVA
jgi:hypothetical protein